MSDLTNQIEAGRKNLSGQQWISILGALFLSIVALWSVAALVHKTIDTNAAMTSETATLERMEEALARRSNSLGSKEQAAIKFPFLSANDRSLAAAEMQALLNEKLNSLNISPASTEIQFPKTEAGLPADVQTVQLRMNIQLLEGQLPSLLSTLETGFPVLRVSTFFIDRDLEMQFKAAPSNQWQKLDVVFTVHGFWQVRNDG